MRDWRVGFVDFTCEGVVRKLYVRGSTSLIMVLCVGKEKKKIDSYCFSVALSSSSSSERGAPPLGRLPEGGCAALRHLPQRHRSQIALLSITPPPKSRAICDPPPHPDR